VSASADDVLEADLTWTPPWRPEFIDPGALDALNRRDDA
jgi:hypothetical protein